MSKEKKLLNRLNRAEGQLRGVIKMMEDGRDCAEVMAQLTAVRSSIDRVIKLVAVENLLDCVSQEDHAAVDHAVDLLTKI